jgi:lycopene beta-cyclase
MNGTIYENVITGAGCAGLSLVWHLLEAGIESPILLIDSRESYRNDRTWCYWGVEPTPFDDLADHSWNTWEIHADANLQAVGFSEKYPYLHLRSDAFYNRVLERIAASPQVRLVLGEKIQSYRLDGDLVIISTSGGEYRGRRVFDSSGSLKTKGLSETTTEVQQSPVGRVGGRWLQHFLGQRIRVNRPVFHPDRIRLMDHRVDQTRGPHFIYLLPYNESTALIENTYFFNAPLSPFEHREEIAHYLAESFGIGRNEYEIIGEESGRIPMGFTTTEPFADERIIPIGTPGGAARAATGYAFLRIQRQSREIATRLMRGRRLSSLRFSFGAAKYRIFDQIMLDALARSPEMAPTFFAILFKHANPGSVVRFLTERSNLLDDLEVMTALLKPDLVRMIFRLTRNGSPSHLLSPQE